VRTHDCDEYVCSCIDEDELKRLGYLEDTYRCYCEKTRGGDLDCECARYGEIERAVMVARGLARPRKRDKCRCRPGRSHLSCECEDTLSCRCEDWGEYVVCRCRDSRGVKRRLTGCACEPWDVLCAE